MKTTLLVVASALALLAVAPAAQAETTLSAVSDSNPCSSGTGVDAVVGDACADPRATWCTLWIEWHAIPSAPTCLVAPLAAAGAGSTDGPINCFPVYSRTDVGTLSIVRRSTCAPPEFYQCPYQGAPLDQCENLLSTTAASSSQPICMYYYYEFTVGPVRYVQRDSCHSEIYVCGVLLKDFLATQPDPVAFATCVANSLGPIAA